MLQQFAMPVRRATALSAAVILGVVTVVPAFMPSAYAAPTVTERELRSTSARPSDTTNLQWVFDTPSDAGTIEYIEFEFCDSPLGTCTAPDGTANTGADFIPILPASPSAAISGPSGFNNPANSATRVNGRAGGTGNQIDINVTTGFSGASADEASIAINGFTNDEQANRSYYTRLRMYSSDTPTPGNMVYEGVFAQSTSQTLTVNARVQERLDFCVGSDDLNDATTTNNGDTAAQNDCTDVTGSSADLGNIENGFTNVTPVSTANGGDGNNGLAMIRTNAFNGAVIDYRALQETSSGALKVAGSTCGDLTPGTGVVTDRCFNSSNTQSTITAGSEEYGMTIAGVNCGSVSAYTCSFAAGTYNLVRDAAYDGTGTNTFVADTDQVSGTTSAGYAWEPANTTDRIASSTTVIDDEALVLKFAATAGVTTPTGSYSVQADYIATATF